MRRRICSTYHRIMGCCSKAVVVAGCCCCNEAIECPPKIGCAQECMACCLDCKFCCEFPCVPLCCGCCGITLAKNCTICKVRGTCFFFVSQISCPCGEDTPILCTFLPFCMVYPRMGCCLTLDGVKKKRKVAPAPDSKDSNKKQGAPEVAEMAR